MGFMAQKAKNNTTVIFVIFCLFDEELCQTTQTLADHFLI